jgi:hypothetical protein
MSEKLHSVEHDNSHGHETHALPEELPKRAEVEKDTAEEVDIKKTRELIDEIHQSSDGSSDEPDNSGTNILQMPVIEPIADTIAKTWRSIRQNLSPPERRYSKIIHNPIISNVSEFTAKTLARPYAILCGGLTALIGSAIYLYFNRQFGFQYNFFVPIFLFAGGLGVGLLVEIAYIGALSRRQK